MISSNSKLLLSAMPKEGRGSIHESAGKKSSQNSAMESMISAKKEWLHKLMHETGSPDYGQIHVQRVARDDNKSRLTNANIEGNNDITLRTNPL